MPSSDHEGQTGCKLIPEEESLSVIDSDYKHVIRLKAKPKDYLFSESPQWVLSPTSGMLVIAHKEEKKNGEVEDGGDHRDSESEVFFSVKSCFSCCSNDEKEVGAQLKDFRGRSIWEEFCHCEGWPFGLFRRALMLPPLPSSPSDSWNWSRKNLVAKVCSRT